jgi:HTH-type transcriptional regulator/antitoxin HigA
MTARTSGRGRRAARRGPATINRRKYGELLVRALPVVIETEEENERMLEEVKKLLRKGDSLTPEEDRLLDLLTNLIEAFEEEHYPIPDAPPHAVLKMLMEDRGLRQRDLLHVFGGSRSITSEVLLRRSASSSRCQRNSLSHSPETGRLS